MSLFPASGSYFPIWWTLSFRDDTKITAAIKAPLMAELKIHTPADRSLQEENIQFGLKEYIFLSLHVFCQRTPHLWQPCKQVTSVSWNEAPMYGPITTSSLSKRKALNPLSALENGFIGSFASLVMLAPVKLLHGRSQILGSLAACLCQSLRFQFQSCWSAAPALSFPLCFPSCSPPC